MGKISDALSKYATERRKNTVLETPPLQLTGLDIDVLLQYDHETGHLLKYNRETGQVDGDRIEQLRMEGTVQRLLDNKLIYPSGKLTPRGIEEAQRLNSKRPDSVVLLRDAFHKTTAPTDEDQRTLAGVAPDKVSTGDTAVLGDDFIAVYETDTKVGEPADAEKLAAPKTTGGTEMNPVTGKAPPMLMDETTVPVRPVVQTHVATARPLLVKTTVEKAAPTAREFDESALDWSLVALKDPHSYEAEQFKILRTNILFPLAGSPPRSILVTSTAPGEGKTFTAANLAISIALNINRYVLLIDADLRRPQLHARFGFPAVPGLSNYLAEGQRLPSLLLRTKIDKLTLLAGGSPPDNPSELLSCDRMARLLEEVTQRYPDRLIVIDAPPPAIAAETSVLARQVDGIIVVVRYGRTRREDLASLVAGLGSKKIIGSLVNGIETASSRYYGYKYGGYRNANRK